MPSVRLNQSGAGTQNLVAAVAGTKLVVTGFIVDVSATTALPQFQDTAATVLAGPFGRAVVTYAAYGTREAPVFETAVGVGLDMVTAGAGTAQGVLYYVVSK